MSFDPQQVRFKDREEAAYELVPRLLDLKGQKPIVLGVPRGAIPMAKIVADALGGELDVMLVKKLGHPLHPEFALGSVTEDGHILLGIGASQYGFSQEYFETEALRTAEDLQRKRQLYTQGKTPIPVAGRNVVVVDDGIATGATMLAAVQSLKEHGAGRIVVASPVASPQAIMLLEREGVEVRALKVPEHFGAVGYYYESFAQVSDAEVGAYFRIQPGKIEIKGKNLQLNATIGTAEKAKGLVIFAQGAGLGRLSPLNEQNEYIAEILNQHGISTVLADLLTEEEAEERRHVFDIEFLAERLNAVTDWVGDQSFARDLPLGIMGSSTGGGAAIQAAATSRRRISAVVLRGGRPDMAREYLAMVKTPILLMVGEYDEAVILMNRYAFSKMTAFARTEKRLSIIPGAGHLFEEPGALKQVAEKALEWFLKHFEKSEFHSWPRDSSHSREEHKRGF